MAIKPNYRQQRSDRVRAKDQKKQERLRRREAKRVDGNPSQLEGGAKSAKDGEPAFRGEEGS